jgi:ubiquinone/menaquinone biosynthesis C-methylase UbiE
MGDKLRETIKRYQSASYAQKYTQEYLGGLDLKSLRSRIIAGFEKSIIERLIKGVVENGDVVLDVPSGSGKLGQTLSIFPVKIVAGDISLEMMSLARGEYARDKLIKLLRLDARVMPLKDNCIDIVICLRLFQRLPKDVRCDILNEFQRITRRYLIISYSYESITQRMRGRLRGLYDREKTMFCSVSLRDIRLELEEAGFILKKARHVVARLSSEVIILAGV